MEEVIVNKVMLSLASRTFFGMETNRISRPQIMLGSSVQDLDDVKKLAESGTQADAMAVIVKIRAGIAAIKYLNHQNPPNVNGRLTAIVNNVGAQFRASQNAHNAAFSNDPTTIGDFWFEWIRALYPAAITHTRTWATEAIRLLRETWDNSADAGAQEILDFLTAYEGDLESLEIDTSSMQ
jgi:hypothetical protein